MNTSIPFPEKGRSQAEQAEYYHSIGKMPDWIYYQLNGKTAQENYNDFHRRQAERFHQQQEERRRKDTEKAALDDFEKKIEAQAEKAVEKARKSLLEKKDSLTEEHEIKSIVPVHLQEL